MGSLTGVGADGLSSIFASPSLGGCPDGARGLALCGLTCKLMGWKGWVEGLKGMTLVDRAIRDHLSELGIRRLPLTMGTGWCWSRMLHWASTAVRVGPPHELKSIQKGIESAESAVQILSQQSGSHPLARAESSVMVLVEPGLYQESVRLSEGCATVWACDRESGEPVVWKSDGEHALCLTAAASAGTAAGTAAGSAGGTAAGGTISTVLTVQVNGCRLSAANVDRAGEVDSVWATAGPGCEMNITLERCDLTCACTAGGSAVLICGVGAVSATIRKCCVHDCVSGDGVFFSSKGKLTLDENDIHSNAGAGVSVVGCGSEAILRNNHVHNGKEGGVYVVDQASATMHNNRILSNDLAGVYAFSRASVTLSQGNSIKGNGQAKIEREEEELRNWPAAVGERFRSGEGLPGVIALEESSLFVQTGDNTISGNGRQASACQILRS